MVKVLANGEVYGTRKNDIDYLITWALTSGSDVGVKITKYSKQIKHNGDLMIFMRKNTD